MRLTACVPSWSKAEEIMKSFAITCARAGRRVSEVLFAVVPCGLQDHQLLLRILCGQFPVIQELSGLVSRRGETTARPVPRGHKQNSWSSEDNTDNTCVPLLHESHAMREGGSPDCSPQSERQIHRSRISPHVIFIITPCKRECRRQLARGQDVVSSIPLVGVAIRHAAALNLER